MALVALDFLRIFQIMIVALGIIIVYFASKSYVKTKSKSMLFLSLGFIFVAIGAATAGLLFEFLDYNLDTVEAISAASQVIGFALIVYSIVGPKD